ncbi:MAG: ATP-dependent Clp protease ATP-binding subunit ClpX, partial [Paludibacteraceae bacterium]|nr:ATP-dependent Clp protease ATP-binding subunit ClpX [Paludibacteraceae bacterium]
EIIGRLPILTYLQPLDRTALRAILTEPKNALTKQYQKLLGMDGVQLRFEDEMLDYIVDQAMQAHLGARGLRGLMEAVMLDIMYERPRDGEFVVTRAYAEERIGKTDMQRMRQAM